MLCSLGFINTVERNAYFMGWKKKMSSSFCLWVYKMIQDYYEEHWMMGILREDFEKALSYRGLKEKFMNL